MKDIKAIFFDFDGVILESVDVKGWAFGKPFEAYPQYVDEIVAFHHRNGGMYRFDKFRLSIFTRISCKGIFRTLNLKDSVKTFQLWYTILY